jgi:hypothetical protein
MQVRKLMGVVLSLVVVLAIAAMQLGVKAQEATEEPTALRTYGGHVGGSEDEFVAVGIGGDNATVYICDGRADEGTVTIAEWFFGPISDNKIDITSSGGHRVEVTVDETTATGKFTFADGTVKEFTLELLEGNAGLFRSEFGFGEVDYVAGWLILPDGSVRGAVRNLETSELTPATFLDFNQMQTESTE